MGTTEFGVEDLISKDFVYFAVFPYLRRVLKRVFQKPRKEVFITP